jgi:hypothetical protein
MKRHLALLLGLPLAVFAQSAVPNSVTYQGKVSDGTGALIGAGTPVNRVITFRIYDNATGGTRLYSERQTVTIANGEFNVLVGGGNAVPGETNAIAFSDLFTGSLRYLGITVDDGNGNLADDPEISPRQQFVSTPYAYRAKVAESLVGNLFQNGNNVGIGTSTPAAPLTINHATEARALLQSTTNGTTGTDGLGLIQSNAGYLWQYENLPLIFGTNSTNRMQIMANGNVGIGTNAPGALLSLGQSLGNAKLAVWDDGIGNTYGLGVQANQLRFHTSGDGDRFSFLAGPAGSEVFTIKGTGNVGIGVTNPVTPLQVFAGAGDAKLSLQTPGTGATATDGLALIMSSASKGYLMQYENVPLIFGTNSQTRMVITAAGNVGLGTSESPSSLLSLGANLANNKLALWDNGAGTTLGFGVQSAQLRLHLGGVNDRFAFLDGPAGSEIMTLTGAGSLGLGVSTPTTPLNVYRATDARASWQTSDSGTAFADGLHVGYQNGLGAFVYNHEASPLGLYTNTSLRLRIEADGRMNFNGASGDGNMGYTLQTGTPYMMVLVSPSNGWRYSFENNGTASKFGASTWNIFSDARLKQNVSPLGGSLEALLKLRSVNFDWKDKANGEGRQTGFIAQEVAQVFPDWVRTSRNGYLTVEHKGFEAHTVQALRELRAEKDAQLAARDAKIAALEQRIQELETQTSDRLAALERRLNAAATLTTAR